MYFNKLFYNICNIIFNILFKDNKNKKMFGGIE